MSTPQSMPAWASVDLAGLTVLIVPTARDAAWWLFLAAVTVFWTGISCYGLVSDGLECATIVIASFNPLMWFLTIGMGLDLITRRELRLAADGLTITTTRFGIPSRQKIPLAGLVVTANHVDGSKGYTNTSVTLQQPGPPPQEAVFRTSSPWPGPGPPPRVQTGLPRRTP
jgi:hypothetical protein